MLKAVANPSGPELGQGVMVTPEGSYVVAQPDLYVLTQGLLFDVLNLTHYSRAAWQKKTHRSAGLTAEQVRERTPTDPSLVCLSTINFSEMLSKRLAARRRTAKNVFKPICWNAISCARTVARRWHPWTS